MNTAIVGGGMGCRSLLKLASGSFLHGFTLNIICVVDIDFDAPGMVYARDIGITTCTKIQDILNLDNLEAIIELTGSDELLQSIYKLIPPGVRLIDHKFAQIFWDLLRAQRSREEQLKEIIQLESVIETERKFLQNIFDGVPSLVVVLDADRRIIRANRPFTDYMNMRNDDVKGMDCRDIFCSSNYVFDCSGDDCPFHAVLNSSTHQTVIRKSASPENYWEETLRSITGIDGETKAILGTWYRITEQVMLRREIEAAEQKFTRFMESAHAMISIKDIDGKYTYVNSYTAELFNLKPSDFIGKTSIEILDEKLAKGINKYDSMVLATNEHITYEDVIQVEGRNRYLSTIRFPLTNYKGAIIGTCTIDRDITKEKELQNQLIQATKMVAVGKLAAGVAHEINNPLTGILAFAEDMRDEMDDDSPFQDDLKVIIRESMRCRNIVRNLLDFSRIESLKFRSVKPNNVVEQALELIEKLVNFRDITIKLNLSDSLPEIQGDQQQLIQVVLNFMLNAADAMKGKGIIIISSVFERENNKVILIVEDNGPGIPENLVDKIFEPFFSTKGTNGLGLAVSCGIIERHLGNIEVDMAETGGAIFRINIPVREDN